MPRNASGVYSLPAGSTAVNGTVIQATTFNTPLTDIQTDLNTVRPINAGGTGASTAAAARVALGISETYSSVSSLEAASPEAGQDHVATAGRVTPGDGGAALYRRVASEPVHDGKIQSADGAWWEIVPEGGVLPVMAFGALPSVADSSTAIQAATAAFPADTVQRGAIAFSADADLETQNEVLLHRKSMTLDGKNVCIKWEGTDAAASMFRVTDSSRVKFTDFALLGDETNPPLAAIRFFRNASGDTTGTNEGCIVDNCVIGRKFVADTTTGGSADATPYASVQYGVLIDGSDGNNDQYLISNTMINGATVAAVNFENTQSIWSKIDHVLVNDSEIGFRLGCSLTMYNVQANRVVQADIVGTRQIYTWIYGFFAENSNQFIQSNAGASFFVEGARLVRNDAAASNFFRVNSGGTLSLRYVQCLNLGGTGDTVYMRPGSVVPAKVIVRDCEIADGDLRDTWDIQVNGAVGSLIDIDHGPIKWRTTATYLDNAQTPGAISAGASALFNSDVVPSAAPLGNVWHVAYSRDLQEQHLTHGHDNASFVRARIFNPTGASITLPAGRMRWMGLGDYIVAKSTESIDAPLLTNNSGHTATIALPGAKLGDYLAWGVGASFINSIVTAYVSAEDEATILIHNASGGSSNPAATDFTVAKISEFGTHQCTLAYSPSAIADGASVTLSVTVPGAQVGSHVFVAYTNDLQGLICTASCSAANTVEIIVSNYTGASVTLGAGHFRVMVAF